ncbi:MAG TPA: hypothetical protein VFS39_03850 [Nitrospira sp.]|nr:hypothetical protein [Nitrospira sp.]
MPIVVGLLLVVAVAALGKFTRFDQDRSFYPTVLVVIASYYVLFATLGGSSQALAWEVVFALTFSVVAIVAGLYAPVVVGIGIAAHGLFDFVHDGLVQNAGVPAWWPAFCGSIDVLLGLWVIGLALSRTGRVTR